VVRERETTFYGGKKTIGGFEYSQAMSTRSPCKVSSERSKNVGNVVNRGKKVSQLGIARVKVTLRLAVYRQSVRLGDKPLETHDTVILFSN
jgi:hypothetical protein